MGEGNSGVRILTTKRAKAQGEDLTMLGAAAGGLAGGSTFKSGVAEGSAIAAVASIAGERPGSSRPQLSSGGFRVPGRASIAALVSEGRSDPSE